MELLNEVMHDGSRNFFLLPVDKVSVLRLFFKIFTLFGAYPTAFVPSVGETWIDFNYKGFKFTINDQLGDYYFMVNDPKCSDSLLLSVIEHFKTSP